MVDYIENLEACAEKRFDEITQGLPKGKFKCPNCEKISELDNAMPSSSNPYSMPICDMCFEAFLEKNCNQFL